MLATGTTYNEAGQVTQDNKFREMGFGYDANGRVVKATRANTPDAHTVHDALGNRVATKVNDVWQYMIYDAFGQLVAEYGVPSEGMGGVKYVQQDHQGSVRTVTNSNGFVLSRTDHQAFGETIPSGIGLRSVNQGYGVDPSTRQGYGLTENDDASGQQHTWFRKLETSAGRFSSPDPYKGSMSVVDPQSFNRYSYVGNQPTNYVDPTGLMCFDIIRTDVVLETGQVLGSWVVGNFCTDDGMGFTIRDREPNDSAVGNTKSDAEIQQAVNDCIQEIWGSPSLRYSVNGFERAAKGRNGSFSIQSNTYRMEQGAVLHQSNAFFVTDTNTFSSRQLAAWNRQRDPSDTRSWLAGYTPSASQSSDTGRNYIANNLSRYRSASLETGLESLIGSFAAVQIHELGNSMRRWTSQNARAKGKYKDKDSGMALEECVFDKLK
jgi:RHS repeat-associated protein